jgi:hypothetical protein
MGCQNLGYLCIFAVTGLISTSVIAQEMSVDGEFDYGYNGATGPTLTIQANPESLAENPALNKGRGGFFIVANGAEIGKMLGLKPPVAMQVDGDKGSCGLYRGPISVLLTGIELRESLGYRRTGAPKEFETYATVGSVVQHRVTEKWCGNMEPTRVTAETKSNALNSKPQEKSVPINHDVACNVFPDGQPYCTFSDGASVQKKLFGSEGNFDTMEFTLIYTKEDAAKIGLSGAIYNEARKNQCSYQSRVVGTIKKDRIDDDEGGSIGYMKLLTVTSASPFKKTFCQ